MKKCKVSMAEGIKVLDDAHSCHWNFEQKILQKLDYDLLRDVFGIITECGKYTCILLHILFGYF